MILLNSPSMFNLGCKAVLIKNRLTAENKSFMQGCRFDARNSVRLDLFQSKIIT